MTPSTPKAISRRALCLGTVSFAAGASILAALPALATEAEVQTAIASDFGALIVPLGDVQIDMPDYSDSGKSVPISVTVPCTMEGLDYPEVVAIYAARNPRPRVGKVFFTPACAEATFSTRIRIESYQDITVVVKMASGEIFKAVRKVDVTYGACEEAVANDQFPPGWAPRMRIALPKEVAANSSVEVRTLISHPMETGTRHNNRGLLIPVRIAENFRCSSQGTTLISAQFEPAIAANPYLAFHLKAERSMELDFTWTDTTGEIYTTTAELVVA